MPTCGLLHLPTFFLRLKALLWVSVSSENSISEDDFGSPLLVAIIFMCLTILTSVKYPCAICAKRSICCGSSLSLSFPFLLYFTPLARSTLSNNSELIKFDDNSGSSSSNCVGNQWMVQIIIRSKAISFNQ